MKNSLHNIFSIGRSRRKPHPPCLIHAGIRKAASTYLQSCFAAQQDLRIASLERLEERIFDDAFTDTPLDKLLACKQSDLPRPQWNGPRMANLSLITNERFAANPRLMKFAPRGHGERDFYERYWALNMAYLKTAVPESKIFLVTRSPDAWVRSNYSQAVRGAIALHRFPLFAMRNREYIKQNLDYQKMRQRFADAFGEDRVLFLPQELLRDDEARFFELLSDFAGHRIRPTKRKMTTAANKNKSPDPLELDRLLTAWRFLRLADKYGRREHFAFYKNFLLKKGREHDPKDKGGPQKIERLFKYFYRNCIEFQSPRSRRIWNSVKEALPDPTRDISDFRLADSIRQDLMESCSFLLDLPGYEQYRHFYRI
jgi:hypothetical protein